MSMQDPNQQPRTSDEVIAALVGLYTLAELHLLMGTSEILTRVNRTLLPITASMTAAIAREHAAFNKLQLDTAMPKIRRLAERLVQLLGMRSPALVDTLVNTARGEAALAAGTSFDFSMPLGVRAADTVRNELNTALRASQAHLLRWDEDLYRELTPKGAIAQVLDNGLTPAQAQAIAWRDFTERGITGFVDKSGKNWNLASYVEMATRTAASRAFNDAHLTVMVALGIDLFTVDDDGNPCPLCLPWQGRILSIHHDDRAFTTIAIAIERGLFHPNCRHVLIKATEADTRPGVAHHWTPADQEAYNASQKQRRLERQIRRAKQQMSISIDAETRRQAATAIRTNNAALTAHLAETGLLRNSRRAQPNLRLDVLPVP